MTSPGELSRRYIEAHNSQHLDELLALVADQVDFQRAGNRPLLVKAAVRRLYEQAWTDHKNVVVNVRQVRG